MKIVLNLTLAFVLTAGAAGCTSAQMISSGASSSTAALSFAAQPAPTPAVSAAEAQANRAATRTRVASVNRARFHGNAPYICTPSGFGQKSSCFLR